MTTSFMCTEQKNEVKHSQLDRGGVEIKAHFPGGQSQQCKDDVINMKGPRAPCTFGLRSAKAATVGDPRNQRGVKVDLVGGFQGQTSTINPLPS